MLIMKWSTESASLSKIERLHRNMLIFDKIFRGKALKEIALDFCVLGFSFDQNVSYCIRILQGQTQPWYECKHSCDHIKECRSTPTHLCRPCNGAHLLLQTDSWGGGGMVRIDLQLGRHVWSCQHSTILLQEPPGKRQHPKARCQSLSQDRACTGDVQVASTVGGRWKFALKDGLKLLQLFQYIFIVIPTKGESETQKS